MHADTDKFRPKLEEYEPYALVSIGWNKIIEDHEAKAEPIQKELVKFLVNKYPPADMAILAKYGKADFEKTVHINIKIKPDLGYQEYCHFNLGQSLLLTDNAIQLFAGGPRYFDRDGFRGMTDQVWNSKTPAQKEALRKSWESMNAVRVPQSCDEWLVKLATIKSSKNHDLRSLRDFLKKKGLTWGAIYEAFQRVRQGHEISDATPVETRDTLTEY